MCEQPIRRGAVPVHRVGRDVDDVARVQHLRLLALEADAADPGQTKQRLPDRMGGPGGARARRERHDRPAEARRRFGGDDRILEHDPGEGLRGAAPGLACSGANDSGFDGHGLSPLLGVSRDLITARAMKNSGTIRVGIGGWVFPPWRGSFYPAGLRQAEELGYASRHLTAIEINGTFYRTQTPSSFKKWH